MTLHDAAAAFRTQLMNTAALSGYTFSALGASSSTITLARANGFVGKVVAGDAAITGASAYRNAKLAFTGGVLSGETWILTVNNVSYTYVAGATSGAAGTFGLATLDALTNGFETQLVDEGMRPEILYAVDVGVRRARERRAVE